MLLVFGEQTLVITLGKHLRDMRWMTQQLDVPGGFLHLEAGSATSWLCELLHPYVSVFFIYELRL